MRKYLLFLTISIASLIGKAQNVGINASGAAPDGSAMLDIVATDKGMLIPRVALSGTGDVATITGTEATGLLVYNTTAAGSGSTAVFANTFYFWNGSLWVAIGGSGGKDWSITGNAGTTAGTHFLGTTDDIDLQFKRNGVLAGKLNSASQLTLFGVSAGAAATGARNTFIGNIAGQTLTTATDNTGVGYNALNLATTSYNTAVGSNAFRNVTTGSSNTGMGMHAGTYFSTGTGNTAIGMYALEGNATTTNNTGSYNTALGFAAGSGYDTTTASPNNHQLTSGSYNTFIGYGASSSTNNFSNSAAIGAKAYVSQSNSIVIGSINGVNQATSSVHVGIGKTTPNLDYALHVTNTFSTAGTSWSNGSLTSAIYGETQATYSYQAGVYGYINGSANNTAGVLGAYSGTQYGALGYKDNSGLVIGTYGTTSSSTGYGVMGENSAATGTGIYGYGSTYGVYGYTPSVAASTYGIFGAWSSARYGYLGGKTSANYFVGAYGTVSGSGDFGLLGWNTHASGTGAAAGGNNVGSVNYLVSGSGGSFTGDVFGSAGWSNSALTTVDRAGGYFQTNAAGSYAYVGHLTTGNVARKITGNGAVSTIVKDTKDNLVLLTCPESPEILFQDFGQGVLINGTAHISLDEIFAKNIIVDDKHPLRVFIQLQGDCNGVYVTNENQSGFDVKELKSGTSNVKFSWFVSANRADEILPDGTLSRYSSERFAPAPGPQKSINAKMESVKDIKDAKRETFEKEEEKK